MDTKPIKTMFVRTMVIMVVVALAFPVTGSAYAQDEPIPFFRAFPDQNAVDGGNWPLGATVHLVIDDPNTGKPRDHEQDATVVASPWDWITTYVRFDFDGVYDLKRGDKVTLTSGEIMRFQIIPDVWVTTVDVETNIVAGTAESGTLVHVFVEDAELFVTADFGAWVADFDDVGFDLLPGMGGAAEVWFDEFNDSTIFNWSAPPPQPNPHFTVFPEWEWFDGLDWPDGAIVSISVAGKPKCSLERESWGGFFNGNFPQGCDIVFGDTVTFTDGATTRTHVVRRLYVTDVDMATNTISGKADAGTTVYVWPHDGWFEPLQTITTDLDEWQVNLGDAGYTIRDDSVGRSEIRDEMGNATASDWHVLHPHFTVFPEWEWFDGLDWPNEAVVTITVKGKDNCTTMKESWGYFFNGSFGEGCDVFVGDEVTFTDGITTRTHTVRNLAVTKVDQEDDTVKGVADPGAKVYVWPHATGQEQLAIAKLNGKAKGKWNADFSGIFDLAPGECGRSEIRDEFGNRTAVDWCIPMPTFVAYIPGAIEGYDWPMGDEISLIINGEDYPTTAFSEQRPDSPPGATRVLFEVWKEGISLKAGDHIVMTDETTGFTKEVWVTNLAVTDFDLSAGTVSGIYDPVYDLWVWLYGQEWQVPATNPSNGTWVATFAELPPGAWGGAVQHDADGDGTSIDFQVPSE